MCTYCLVDHRDHIGWVAVIMRLPELALSLIAVCSGYFLQALDLACHSGY